MDGLAGLNGVRVAAPDGAFYLPSSPSTAWRDSLGLALRLVRGARRGAVAPGAAFGAGGEGHLRVCFAQSQPRGAWSRAMTRLRAGLQAR